MLRWVVGGVFVAVMIVVGFLARAIVDNFGIAGTGVWILGSIAIRFWIEQRKERARPSRGPDLW
jgi:preprotein translocase subunit SecY